MSECKKILTIKRTELQTELVNALYLRKQVEKEEYLNPLQLKRKIANSTRLYERIRKLKVEIECLNEMLEG